MKLSNFFIKRKIHAMMTERSDKRSRFRSFQDVRNIGVVFHVKDREEVAPCLKMLEELHKTVYACAYIPAGKKDETDPAWLQVREEEDTDSKKIPTNEICERFNALPCDILIDLTRADNYVMHYLVLQYTGAFKVGSRSAARNICDLTVVMSEGDGIRQLFEHILFYLRTIRSK
ncbi:MAG: hypothetical protein LBQ78_07020 [Tannerellaceae bacterium]|jgi:hypothetical protein|nr:hypothetical protein [Tannerellaceae bacterium]